MTSDSVRTWAAVLRINAAVLPRLERAVLAASGLSLSSYDVLLELHQGGRLTMGELSERVVLSRSRVSRIVDDLVREGLVDREGNPADRRSAFATLTETGESKFRLVASVYLPAIEREFARVDASTIHSAAETLSAVAGIVASAGQGGVSAPSDVVPKGDG